MTKLNVGRDQNEWKEKHIHSSSSRSFPNTVPPSMPLRHSKCGHNHYKLLHLRIYATDCPLGLWNVNFSLIQNCHSNLTITNQTTCTLKYQQKQFLISKISKKPKKVLITKTDLERSNTNYSTPPTNPIYNKLWFLDPFKHNLPVKFKSSYKERKKKIKIQI